MPLTLEQREGELVRDICALPYRGKSEVWEMIQAYKKAVREDMLEEIEMSERGPGSTALTSGQGEEETK